MSCILAQVGFLCFQLKSILRPSRSACRLPSMSEEPYCTKVAPLLDRLADATRVGVMMMPGSLCPVTLGHTMSLAKARDIIMGVPGVARPTHLETFGEALGYFSLNDDQHVGKKLQRKGDMLSDFYGSFDILCCMAFFCLARCV